MGRLKVCVFMLILCCFLIAYTSGAPHRTRSKGRSRSRPRSRSRSQTGWNSQSNNVVHITKPEHWTAKYLPDKIDITIKELKDIKRFPGAAYKKPDNFRFRYLPSHGFLENAIVEGNYPTPLALLDTMYKDKQEGTLKGKVTDDLVTIYWRYAMCRKGIDVKVNCPDVCKKPGVCTRRGEKRGSCTARHDDSVDVDLVPRARGYWSTIFKQSNTCKCRKGYRWNSKRGQCKAKKMKPKTTAATPLVTPRPSVATTSVPAAVVPLVVSRPPAPVPPSPDMMYLKGIGFVHMPKYVVLPIYPHDAERQKVDSNLFTVD